MVVYLKVTTMSHFISQILAVSKIRIAAFAAGKDSRYKGAETYFEQLRKEIDEAQTENKPDNHVYLEDELGDIFRDYVMLLNAMANEGKISSIEKVFERCYKKFSERIGEDGVNRGDR